MIERIRKLLGITEAEDDTVDAVARLHVRLRTLEADVARLDAVVRQLAQKPTHDIDEVSRKRFMREWLQRSDPNGGAS
ncbi:MAG: hypothetical protein EBR82_46625 [Caulobacteraceae bacterium]|nr:hypothetical protein [Caulobacteraceae bacterium]